MFGRFASLRRRLVTATVAAVLFGAGVGGAFWYFGWPGDLWGEMGPYAAQPPRESAPPSSPAPSADDDKPQPEVGPATILVFERHWQQCDRVQTSTMPAGERLAGADAERLAAEFPGWEVAAFGADEVRLVQSLPGDCPGPETPFTITVREGKVVVLRGEGLAGPLYMSTEIRSADLLPGDQELLRRGVTVVGEERVWQFLEGMREHAQP